MQGNLHCHCLNVIVMLLFRLDFLGWRKAYFASCKLRSPITFYACTHYCCHHWVFLLLTATILILKKLRSPPNSRRYWTDPCLLSYMDSEQCVTAHLQKWVREKPRLRGFLNVFLEDTKNDVCENAAFSWWKILFVWKTTNYQKYVIYLPVLL